MEEPIISCFINFTVPSGRLLVIETVSFEVFTPPGQRAVEDIFIAQDGVDGIFFYAVPLAGTFFGNDIQTGTSSVKLYADPGTTVKVRTTRNIGTVRRQRPRVSRGTLWTAAPAQAVRHPRQFESQPDGG
jgi:hypothetical protein